MMKYINVMIHSVNDFWAHKGLQAIVERRSGWEMKKVRNFLRSNKTLTFSKMGRESALKLFKELEDAGFEVALDENKNVIGVHLGLSTHETIKEMRAEIHYLNEKINGLEVGSDTDMKKASVIDSAIYKKVQAILDVDSGEQKEHSQSEEQFSEKKKFNLEEWLGKYALSCAGVLSLVLGLVFFVVNYSRDIGAWGKLAIAGVVSFSLIAAGHYLSVTAKYRKWAMFSVGGGWAVLFFSVFAAFHVEAVKVIDNPVLALVLLLTVGGFMIFEAVSFRSRIMILSSYLFAYLAVMTTNVTLYSLAASYLLAVSAFFVIRKVSRIDWFVCVNMLLVYICHAAWVQPSIAMGSSSVIGAESLYDYLLLPWVNDRWSVYPLMDTGRSLLHLAFLFLYWKLFALMGLFRKNDDKADRRVILPLYMINNLLFAGAFMHHLHVYHNLWKWVFALFLGCAFFVMSFLERKRNWTSVADILAFYSLSAFTLILPMCFDGAPVTYGWGLISAGLIYFGARFKTKYLSRYGLVLFLLAVCRLVFFDYSMREAVFTFVFGFNRFFFAAAFMTVVNVFIMKNAAKFAFLSEKSQEQLHVLLYNLGWGISIAAVLMGGMRSAASVYLLCAGGFLLWKHFERNQTKRPLFALILIVCGGLRMMSVDFDIEYDTFLVGWRPMLRYAGVWISIILLGVMSERLRSLQSSKELPVKMFKVLFSWAVILLSFSLIDAATSSILSLLWGVTALGVLIYGFRKEVSFYRFVGLIFFGIVGVRLYLYDLKELEVAYRILCFMGLGAVFILASLGYSYYAKAIESSKR